MNTVNIQRLYAEKAYGQLLTFHLSFSSYKLNKTLENPRIFPYINNIFFLCRRWTKTPYRLETKFKYTAANQYLTPLFQITI